jgi:uncharacterized membrane protein YvlD (DUF360 family)
MPQKIVRTLLPPIVSFATLIILAWLLPGLLIQNAWTAVAGFLILSLLNIVVRPLLVRLTLRINVFTFGLLSVVFNGLMVMAVQWFVPGFQVSGIFTGMFIALVLVVVNTLLENLLYGKDDRRLREYHKLQRYARKIPNRGDVTTPGLIILEIDGLAEPILQRAIREGIMPTLAAWVHSGQYKIVPWDSGLPSQTSAMQAGILHGTHFNIPAFRWFDKTRKRLLVSGSALDADDILKPLLNGHGLLRENGFSLNNWAYGDAGSVVLTFSAMTDPQRGMLAQADNLYGYFADADSLPHALAGMIRDIAQEWREARYQRTHNVLPRVERGGVYPLIRAITTVLMPQLSRSLIVTKMFEGIASAYTTFVNYDEVAHHSGIDRPDTFRVLGQLDEQLSWIANAAKETPRPYEFVILSDHGQSQGATFRQRYGQTLQQLVTSLLDDEHRAAASIGGDNGLVNVNMMLSTAVYANRWMAQPVRQLLRRRMSGGFVDLHPTHDHEAVAGAKTVVCASGNLGLIYFTEWPDRLTLEQITDRFPGFIDGLIEHPGIGFLLVRSAEHGGLALGKGGVYYLADDRIEGDNPLAGFGPHAAQHLRELNTYANVGDVVVNSLYDPATGEVAAFEELVGSHGGLGGTQTTPFLMYPAHLEPEDGLADLVGAPRIYSVLRAWIAQLQHPTGAAPPTPPLAEPAWSPPQPAPSSS